MKLDDILVLEYDYDYSREEAYDNDREELANDRWTDFLKDESGLVRYDEFLIDEILYPTLLDVVDENLYTKAEELFEKYIGRDEIEELWAPTNLQTDGGAGGKELYALRYQGSFKQYFETLTKITAELERTDYIMTGDEWRREF